MGKKRLFSPEAGEAGLTPRIKQTRLESFLSPAHTAATELTQATLQNSTPSSCQVNTRERSKHPRPLTSSSASQTQPCVLVNNSSTDPANLLLQHSLQTSSTVNVILSHLETIVTLLKSLLKGPREAFTSSFPAAPPCPSDTGTSRELPPLPLPVSPWGRLDKSLRLIYDPNTIAISLRPWNLNHGSWSRPHQAKRNLAAVLKVNLSQIDLLKIERLTPLNASERLLCHFSTSKIPKLLHQRSRDLIRCGITTQRHFKNTQVRSLLPFKCRMQIPKSPIYTPELEQLTTPTQGASQATGFHTAKTSKAPPHATDLETRTSIPMTSPVASVSYPGKKTSQPNRLGTPTASAIASEKEPDPPRIMTSSTAPVFPLETQSGLPRSPRHLVPTHVIANSVGLLEISQNPSNSLPGASALSSPVNTCSEAAEVQPSTQLPLAPLSHKPLRILSWNVGGWGNKARDADFTDYLRNFEIILLQETWLVNPLNFDGYNSISLPAHKSSVKGRPAGGLTILSKPPLAPVLLFMADSHCMLQVIKFNFPSGNLVLFNVYIPPKPDKLSRTRQWDYLFNVLIDVNSRSHAKWLLLAGDFNARVGSGDDIYALIADELSLPDTSLFHRSSKDKVINDNGISLATLCVAYGLIWLNGLLDGDRYGEFTFVAPWGASAIDYIMVSESLLPLIGSFQIEPPLLSDHLPLCCSLSTGICYSFPIVSSPPHKPHHCPLYIKWNNKTKNSFFTLVSNGSLISCITPDDMPVSDSILNTYNLLIKVLLNDLGQPNSLSNASRTPPTPFDNTAQKLKFALRQIYKDYKANGYTKLPPEYFSIKNKLTQVLKSNRQQLITERWDTLIKASRTKNQKLFWKIINATSSRVSNSSSPSIPAPQWEAYFRKLFSDNKAQEQPLDSSELAALPTWPPVSQIEILSLIAQLKPGKAAGPDFIPSDLIISAPLWWAPFLADLFTNVDISGQIPTYWTQSFIVPIHKKGDRLNPSNFRPISLLSIPGKLFASHLLTKLTSWIEDNNILGPEQAGFRNGRSTLEHCLTLSHLAEKQLARPHSRLFTAFLDLRAAFDLVNRNLLWAKLTKLGIDKRLLFLIRRLYEHTSCQVRYDTCGNLTGNIDTNRGVKQGCVLAPTLFNLFINDLAPHLAAIDSHCPTLNRTPVYLLLYADDMVLLSRTRVGLRRLLLATIDYLETNLLQLNYDKSKILVFEKRWKHRSWLFKGKSIQQVKTFKYLGLTFQYRLSWTQQRIAVSNSAKLLAQSLLRFSFIQGNSFIPAALKVFNAKVIPHLFYAIQLWIPAFKYEVERIQSAFLYKIFGVAHCVAYATLCLEAGQLRLEFLAWLKFCKFWLKILFNANHFPYINDLLSDPFLSSGLSLFYKKIQSIGLSPDCLGHGNLASACKILTERLMDIERQNLIAAASKTHSPLFFHLPLSIGMTPRYLELLINPQLRRAFTLARCNAMPTQEMAAIFNSNVSSTRCQDCSWDTPDSLVHLIFACPYYTDLRTNYIAPLISDFPGASSHTILHFLLSSTNTETVHKVALFLNAVILRKRAKSDRHHLNPSTCQITQGDHQCH